MHAGKIIGDVTVVIRSVDERTAAACRHLVAQQVPPGNVVVVSNAPFSATLSDCYRAGIARGLPWTLCLDADVLVAAGAVERMLEATATLDASVCEIQGTVLDKFFGVRRPAGNHLYRTSLLPKALDLILVDGTDIRPEFHTLNRMAEAGYSWLQLPLVVGVHDFEQSYQDIFRKGCVHARKHLGLVHHLVAYWQTMAPRDDDFQVALRGLAAGIAASGDVRVDVRRDYGFTKWVTDDGWKEKLALAPEQVTTAEVSRILADWPSPGKYLEAFAEACVAEGGNGPGSNRAGQKTHRPWTLRSTVGRVFSKVGRALERTGYRWSALAPFHDFSEFI